MKKLLLLFLLAGLQLAAHAQDTKMKTKTVHRHTHHKHMTKHVYKKHNIVVHENDDHAAYDGKSSHINDGVKKNQQRNLNYQNNGANLPPNNGNNAR